ncbi:hypothetical protein A2V61_01935 [Candidatus Woesebacteria bacterium RBG_19FT_COMBO_47_8]|nr:MAG: hypothetical protein A2V61_01935 [Candidatus Woesebacteria bacterium RBG_19FT_COMBO_47_8]
MATAKIRTTIFRFIKLNPLENFVFTGYLQFFPLQYLINNLRKAHANIFNYKQTIYLNPKTKIRF